MRSSVSPRSGRVTKLALCALCASVADFSVSLWQGSCRTRAVHRAGSRSSGCNRRGSPGAARAWVGSRPYLTRRDEATARADAEAYDALVARRERREPVAYITGVGNSGTSSSSSPPRS